MARGTYFSEFEAGQVFTSGGRTITEADVANLDPADLLGKLKVIEAAMGRRDGLRWGPRVIDLDLLLFGTRRVQEPALTIPHPRLHERGFVLEPLVDLEPDLTLPDGRKVKDLFSALK